jgi:hypothetical protein
MLKAEIVFFNNEKVEIIEKDRITLFSNLPDGYPTHNEVELSNNGASQIFGLSNGIMNAIWGYEYFQIASKNDTIYRTSAIVKIQDVE